MDAAIAASRPELLRRGKRLEQFTIAWNTLEALVSIIAGIVVGSVALVGFGLDSVIEVASGAALLWRLHHDHEPNRRAKFLAVYRILSVIQPKPAILTLASLT